jgi:hypothetical protein
MIASTADLYPSGYGQYYRQETLGPKCPVFRDPEYCECAESEPRPELNAVGRAEWRCAKCGGRAIGDDGEE